MREVSLIEPDWDAPANVIARVSTRPGGYSKGAKGELNLATHVGDDEESVVRNRQLFAGEFGDIGHWQWMNQVHGTEVARIHEPGEVITGDGLVTSKPGIACCVLTADCLPLFLCNESGTEVAVVHCGWRGMAAGVVTRALAQMESPTQKLLAWMGPAIGVCHFEVGEDVLHAFWGRSDDFLACFVPAPRPGKYWADLYEICRLLLQRLGVERISGGGFCTYCDDTRFFSHRRDPDGGRMASAICLSED